MSRIIHCETYDVVINDAEDFASRIAEAEYSRIIAIADESAYHICFRDIHNMIPDQEIDVIRVPSGEKNKTIKTVQYIWDKMLDLGADRNSLCLCIGGGVVGDMGGFAASTFMRGIDFYQLPTTLLAQVDASVGGKLGIDYHGYKNLIGVIKKPTAVYIFTQFLDSLPYRQILSGSAELLKHGMIRDAENYSKLARLVNLEAIRWEGVIYDSILLKKSITDEDPLEKGIRKILNYGHTVGHAVESLSFKSDRPLLHGEAIAIGLVVESYISYLKGYLSLEDAEGIKKDILKLYGHHPSYVEDHESLLNYMKRDKKNKNGMINFTLLEGLGNATINHTASQEMISQAINFYTSAL